MKVSIIVPVFNNWIYTKQAIQDLDNLPPDHEILIIDNGSTDYTPYVSRKFNSHPRIHFHRLNKNEGYAKSVNYGFSLSNSEYVIFLNNDIHVTKAALTNWTEPLLAQALPNTLVSPTAGILDASYHFLTHTEDPSPPNSYLSAWCLAGTRETFQSLTKDSPGPFSELFGLAFFEDVELSFRAKEKGIKLVVQPIQVTHYGHKTSNLLGTDKLYTQAHQVFCRLMKYN